MYIYIYIYMRMGNFASQDFVISLRELLLEALRKFCGDCQAPPVK